MFNETSFFLNLKYMYHDKFINGCMLRSFVRTFMAGFMGFFYRKVRGKGTFYNTVTVSK